MNNDITYEGIKNVQDVMLGEPISGHQNIFYDGEMITHYNNKYYSNRGDKYFYKNKCYYDLNELTAIIDKETWLEQIAEKASNIVWHNLNKAIA